ESRRDDAVAQRLQVRHEAVPPELLAARAGDRTGLPLQQALQPGQCHEMNPPRKKNKDKRPTAGGGDTMLGGGRGRRDADGSNGSGARRFAARQISRVSSVGRYQTRVRTPAKAVYQELRRWLARSSAGGAIFHRRRTGRAGRPWNLASAAPSGEYWSWCGMLMPVDCKFVAAAC